MSPPRHLLSHADLHGLGIKYSRVHLRRLTLSNRFPKPLKIGRENLWLASEIADFVDQAAARR